MILRISKTQNQVVRAEPTESSSTHVQDQMPHGQGGTTTVLVSNVTAPLRASALPFNVAPVVMVMDDSAMMVPLNFVVVRALLNCRLAKRRCEN